MKDAPNQPLPTGWAICTIGDVTLPVLTADPRTEPKRLIDYIEISGIDNHRNVIARTKKHRLADAPSRARQIVKAGDVLFSTVRPYLRNIARVPHAFDNQVASTGFAVLRPASGIDPAFLFYKAISRDFVNALSGLQYGVSYPAVTEDQVHAQPLLLPPSSEQTRIVSKLEELLSELDKGVENLEATRRLIDAYRQSLLKSAFAGALTNEWRCHHAPHSSAKLIEQLNLDRQQRHAKEISSWTRAVERWKGHPDRQDKPAKPQAPIHIEPISVDEGEELPELPANWAWIRLEALCAVSGGLTKNETKRRSLSRRMKYLRVANVYADRLELQDVHDINVTDDEADKVALKAGDILVVEGNGSVEQIGRVALWSEELPECGHQNHLIRVRPTHGLLPRYLLQFLLSPIGRRIIMKKASSTSGLHTLSISKVSSLPIPVTDVGEQRALLDDLDAKLSRTHTLLREVDEQASRAEALRQALFLKAFSGSLVPQDQSEESAADLLGRIRAQKDSGSVGVKKSRTTTRKKESAA